MKIRGTATLTSIENKTEKIVLEDIEAQIFFKSKIKDGERKTNDLLLKGCASGKITHVNLKW